MTPLRMLGVGPVLLIPTALVVALCLAMEPSWLRAQSNNTSAGALRVAVVGSEPFVVESDSVPDGLSVEVWRAVAARLNLDFELLVAADVVTALEQVAAREVDVVVGPISITAERAERVSFTQPYFNSSLAILAPPAASLYSRFAPFLSRTFLIGAAALVAILVLVGTLIWLTERQWNPDQFPKSRLAGIGNGIWMALVTMTTVGYGDRVPTTVVGRFITGIWMLLSLVIASSLTAFLATALTLSQMTGPAITTADDLRGLRVGVVDQTTSEAFAADYGARGVPFADVGTAVASLESGDVDAVVFDRPILSYLLLQQPGLDLRLSEASYQPQNYGFALNADSRLTDEIGLAILQLQGEGELRRIEEAWLGR